MFLQHLNCKIKTSSGISKLDLLLNGGLEPGEILEIYGKTSTGKSQLCQTILKEFCHNRKDGTTALYIDAKNDLVPSRLFRLFEKCPISMRRVRVLRESKLKFILKALQYFDQEMVYGQSHFCEKLKLIVVDSLPTILYGIEADDNDGWRGEVELFIAQLKNMATKYGFIVIMINHAVSNYSGGGFRSSSSSSFNASTSSKLEVKPALGKYWTQVPHFRISLTRLYGFNSIFRATLEKGSRVATNQYFDFYITESGVE